MEGFDLPQGIEGMRYKCSWVGVAWKSCPENPVFPQKVNSVFKKHVIVVVIV